MDKSRLSLPVGDLSTNNTNNGVGGSPNHLPNVSSNGASAMPSVNNANNSASNGTLSNNSSSGISSNGSNDSSAASSTSSTHASGNGSLNGVTGHYHHHHLHHHSHNHSSSGNGMFNSKTTSVNCIILKSISVFLLILIKNELFSGHGCQSLERNCNSAASSSLTNGHSGSHSSTSNKENGHGNGPATPCTPGDPLTHYHHRNEDHYTASFACMNRMRIHSQVRI